MEFLALYQDDLGQWRQTAGVMDSEKVEDALESLRSPARLNADIWRERPLALFKLSGDDEPLLELVTVDRLGE